MEEGAEKSCWCQDFLQPLARLPHLFCTFPELDLNLIPFVCVSASLFERWTCTSRPPSARPNNSLFTVTLP